MALDPGLALPPPSLLEALPDTVVVADRDGRIAYVNPAVGRLLGHEPSPGDEGGSDPSFVQQPFATSQPAGPPGAGFGAVVAGHQDQGIGEELGIAAEVVEELAELGIHAFEHAAVEGPLAAVAGLAGRR